MKRTPTGVVWVRQLNGFAAEMRSGPTRLINGAPEHHWFLHERAYITVCGCVDHLTMPVSGAVDPALTTCAACMSWHPYAIRSGLGHYGGDPPPEVRRGAAVLLRAHRLLYGPAYRVSVTKLPDLAMLLARHQIDLPDATVDVIHALSAANAAPVHARTDADTWETSPWRQVYELAGSMRNMNDAQLGVWR